MSLTVEELRAARCEGAGPAVIDVRSCGEFAAGHLQGAVSIPMDEIEARLDDIPANGPLALVCQSGDRAQIVCGLIRDRRPMAEVLEGGTEAWEAAGLPMVASTRTRWSLERQVRLTAGLIVLTGTLSSLMLSSSWVYLAMFVGAGLTFAGLTNICGMGLLFAHLPWNKPPKPSSARTAPKTS